MWRRGRPPDRPGPFSCYSFRNLVDPRHLVRFAAEGWLRTKIKCSFDIRTVGEHSLRETALCALLSTPHSGHLRTLDGHSLRETALCALLPLAHSGGPRHCTRACGAPKGGPTALRTHVHVRCGLQGTMYTRTAHDGRYQRGMSHPSHVAIA